MPGTGTISISQPLDFDMSPGTDVGGNPALVYNEGTVDDHPIIQVDVPTAPDAGVPSDIKLTLIFDGTTVTNTYDMPSGVAPGTPISWPSRLPAK